MSLVCDLRGFLVSVQDSTETRVNKAVELFADPDVDIVTPGDLVGADAEFLVKCMKGSISAGPGSARCICMCVAIAIRGMCEPYGLAHSGRS